MSKEVIKIVNKIKHTLNSLVKAGSIRPSKKKNDGLSLPLRQPGKPSGKTAKDRDVCAKLLQWKAFKASKMSKRLMTYMKRLQRLMLTMPSILRNSLHQFLRNAKPCHRGRPKRKQPGHTKNKIVPSDTSCSSVKRRGENEPLRFQLLKDISVESQVHLDKKKNKRKSKTTSVTPQKNTRHRRPVRNDKAARSLTPNVNVREKKPKRGRPKDSSSVVINTSSTETVLYRPLQIAGNDDAGHNVSEILCKKENNATLEMDVSEVIPINVPD